MVSHLIEWRIFVISCGVLGFTLFAAFFFTIRVTVLMVIGHALLN